MNDEVLIIGGGAAGLMCAITAAQYGRRVRVLDHANRVGKKILMSGGGRCNFTNLNVKPENFLSANPHFCKSALARYRPEHFIAMVERHGIAYHEKELGQLFCDDSSKQIVKMLLDECEAAGVIVEVSCEIQNVSQGDGAFVLQTSLGQRRAPKLVIACGGLSIPSMGASGFGYQLARQFGHTVLLTRAGLVPFTLSGKPLEQWQDLSGLALDIEASCGDARFRNRMLLTHRGLSGPAILQVSSYWQPGVVLRLDLFPQGDALGWLTLQQREHRDAELKTVLGERFPKRFAQRLCETLLQSKPLRQYTPAELRAVAKVLHHWPVTPSGTEGYRTAEVTLGGVSTDELSSSTMESKRMPGLYFVGEVVDVTGWLGGYNFQWAWASGAAAGVTLGSI